MRRPPGPPQPLRLPGAGRGASSLRNCVDSGRRNETTAPRDRGPTAPLRDARASRGLRARADGPLSRMHRAPAGRDRKPIARPTRDSEVSFNRVLSEVRGAKHALRTALQGLQIEPSSLAVNIKRQQHFGTHSCAQTAIALIRWW